MKTIYQPLGNRVLIKKIKLEEQTTGGIIIPIDQAKHDYGLETVATIISLGAKVDRTLGLKVGQKIKYCQHSQKILKDDIMIVEDKNIQAIIYENADKVECTSMLSTGKEFLETKETK